MKHWEKAALDLLQKSLEPIPQEHNEIDWKSALSENTEKLTHHLSAFSNHSNGGFIVFGVDDKGRLRGIGQDESGEIIKKLGNIARDGLEPAIPIDHAVLPFKGINLLFIFIQESPQKPVHVRGKTIHDSYVRSAGQTRRMSKQEVARCVASSSSHAFEEEAAEEHLTGDEVIRRLDFVSYFDLLKRDLPRTQEEILGVLEADRLVHAKGNRFDITNLGALLFAKDLNEFHGLQRKAVRVILYDGKTRIKTIKEQPGRRGYASGFAGLMKYINDQLPTNEVIEQALRKQVKMYPEIAVRELVANALIHQDFLISGAGPTVEVFSDRIEVTSPGRPMISPIRFIDYPPRSRNEILASFMRRINICEERGSGIDKVVSSAELFQLPAPAFLGEQDDYLKAILYASIPFAEMSKEDKIRACYQHCVLKHVSNEKMTNQSLRTRFNITDENYPIASRIIADTIQEGLIKLLDPESGSKKFASYIPFWA